MQRREFLVGGIIVLVSGAAGRSEAQQGFVKLYNGRDLSGWHARGGKIEAWKANGETISCVAPGGGWLTTDRQYGDFVLRLEYRIGPGGNSGVGIRYPAEGDPAHEGMEIQILDDTAEQYRNLRPAQYNGGIYYQVAPRMPSPPKVGQWNRYVIRCQGPRIRVRHNGVLIHDVNVEEHTRANGNYKPLSERPRRGYIGVQSHGDPVDFRNIEIREL